MFGKKDQKTESVQEAAAAQERVRQEKLQPFDIHVMPTKFQHVEPKKKGGQMWVLIILLLLIIAGGAAAAYLYFKQPPSAEPAPQPQTPEAAAPATNTTPTNAPTNTAVQPTNTAPVTPAPAAPTNAAPASTTPTAAQQTLGTALDSDNDALTDTEEGLYDTDIHNPDTDGDGYMDGAEVASGYSPKAANTLLVNTSYVNTYTNPVFNYSILYPSRWLVRPSDQTLTVIQFQPATREFVQLTRIDNPGKQALADWYAAAHPGDNINALKQGTTRGGLSYLIDPSGIVEYLAPATAPDHVFELKYDPQGAQLLSFRTTFEMMAQSLKDSQ